MAPLPRAAAPGATVPPPGDSPGGPPSLGRAYEADPPARAQPAPPISRPQGPRDAQGGPPRPRIPTFPIPRLGPQDFLPAPSEPSTPREPYTGYDSEDPSLTPSQLTPPDSPTLIGSEEVISWGSSSEGEDDE